MPFMKPDETKKRSKYFMLFVSFSKQAGREVSAYHKITQSKAKKFSVESEKEKSKKVIHSDSQRSKIY